MLRRLVVIVTVILWFNEPFGVMKALSGVAMIVGLGVYIYGAHLLTNAKHAVVREELLRGETKHRLESEVPARVIADE
jgi:hypothetical protein